MQPDIGWGHCISVLCTRWMFSERIAGGMMKRDARFTLLELVVAIGIIALLVGILVPVVGTVREKSQKTACASSIRSLSMSVQLYWNDFGTYPSGWLRQNLFGQYHDSAEGFDCPSTKKPYELFYVPRTPAGLDRVFLSCARHQLAAAGPGKGVRPAPAGEVLFNGVPVVGGATIEDGPITFEDGTTVTVNGKAFVLASFYTEIHRLYNAMRVFVDYDKVTLNATVPVGSSFEAIVPAATITASGATLQIKTDVLGASGKVNAKIKVTAGVADVTTWNGEGMSVTPASGQVTVIGPVTDAHRLPPWL